MTSEVAGKCAFPLRRKPRRSQILVPFQGTSEWLAGTAQWLSTPQKVHQAVGLTGGEGDIAHKPGWTFQLNHYPWVLKEVEGGAIPSTDKHEVDAGPAVLEERRSMVELAAGDVGERCCG